MFLPAHGTGAPELHAFPQAPYFLDESKMFEKTGARSKIMGKEGVGWKGKGLNGRGKYHMEDNGEGWKRVGLDVE